MTDLTAVFEITLQTSDDQQRVVFFNHKKHKPLSEIHQEETGCELRRYKMNDKKKLQ